MKSIWKMTRRSIRSHPARYWALFLIVALSAGFFAGLKIARDAMVHTGDTYFKDQKLYDFQIVSTIGFPENILEDVTLPQGIAEAEANISLDVLAPYEESVEVFRLYSLPERLNVPTLVEGRMPQEPTECLADARQYSLEDLGKTVTVSESTPQETGGLLAAQTYTIVGTVNTPLHIGVDRGQTKLGSGSVFSYLYLMPRAFTLSGSTQISLYMGSEAEIYTEEYDAQVEALREDVTAFAQQLTHSAYGELLASMGLTPEMAAQMGMEAPQCYVLTREENAGYVNFDNDTQIIHSVSGLFPVFFILIAILVCVTTMTRMVDEERTQLGTMKALGFSDGQIIAKYLLYALAATIPGWVVGFFFLTWMLPVVFWEAYQVLYQFAPVTYLFSPSLAAVSLGFSLVCILGSTYLSCRKELRSVAAELIRPRAAIKGKRILLERIRPLWKRLSFLQKVTLRNMFRYKQRLAMMLVGIGACAGLLVTGFGIRDSMLPIADRQYGQVQCYEVEAYFEEGKEATVEQALTTAEGVETFAFVRMETVETEGPEKIHRALLLCYDRERGLEDFWTFAADGETLPLPEKGEALINFQTAKRLELEVGDEMTFTTAEGEEGRVIVSGIFDSYIQNHVVLTTETYEALFAPVKNNCLYLKSDGDAEHLAEQIVHIEAVTGVTNLVANRSDANEVLTALNIIIALVVGFAGALSFIVIFNLTNINLAERSREIATVRVLGFDRKETAGYALRENLVLSGLAAILGLPLGTLLHGTIMDIVDIDLFSFPTEIKVYSYGISFVLSLCFAFVINLFMRRSLGKINMAESLKAVE